jgi:hypothetical protein
MRACARADDDKIEFVHDINFAEALLAYIFAGFAAFLMRIASENEADA